MPDHDLLAEPARCGRCKDGFRRWNEKRRGIGLPPRSFARWEKIRKGYHPHTFAQDAAIALAVRTAAGGENPVAWMTWTLIWTKRLRPSPRNSTSS